jgi:hypothetical protein
MEPWKAQIAWKLNEEESCMRHAIFVKRIGNEVFRLNFSDSTGLWKQLVAMRGCLVPGNIYRGKLTEKCETANK